MLPPLLLCAAGALAALLLLWRVLLHLAPGWYRSMIRDNAVDVDAFVGGPPSPTSALKAWALNRVNLGTRVPRKEGYRLKTEESDKVPGLRVTMRDEGEGAETKKESGMAPPVVVGTIRMGFGHHRIAYAASSWGLDGEDAGGRETGINPSRETWFHDFLNIDSEEAQMIKDTDKLYSKGSRLASELGGPVEKFWGGLTKSGDETSLRCTYQFSEHMVPLIQHLDKRSPIIASHSMVACAAVAAGFENVINLVIDNHAQWFVVVPGALNLVQGPSNYHAFLRMGVPAKDLAVAGHWIPKDLVEGIPAACARRRARRAGNRPLRIVVPVGGAGAQRKFIVKFVGALAPLVKAGRVQLFLNAADHAHMKEAFVGALDAGGMEYGEVTDMEGVQAFRKHALTGEPARAVTLFSYADYFTAVATTDLLCGVADVLACKPSELAFYPLPKLMLRRVGDHEAYSALRASELGDGTLEVREVPSAVRYVELFLGTDLIDVMCDAIEANHRGGIYDGCKNAMRLALERAERK